MHWTRVWNSWLCCTYQVHRVDPQTAPLQGLHREDFHPRHVEDHRLSHRKKAITSQSSCICIPSKYSGRIWTQSKSPMDVTRALIERALVLMTLNPFERVAVSLKIVSMLLHSSSPPASLVFDVFFMRTNFQKTFENAIWVVRDIWFFTTQIFKRPLRMQFEL